VLKLHVLNVLCKCAAQNTLYMFISHVSLFYCSSWDGLAWVLNCCWSHGAGNGGTVLLVTLIFLMSNPVLCPLTLEYAAPASLGSGRLQFPANFGWKSLTTNLNKICETARSVHGVVSLWPGWKSAGPNNFWWKPLIQRSRDSRYSDWLRAGRPKGRGSSPGRIKNFLFSTSSSVALGPTQPPIQWVPGALSARVKWPWREADHSAPTSAEVKKNVNLYIHSPVRLHGVMLI
jgi:hypothetical protein